MTGSWWSSTEGATVPSDRTVRGRVALPSSKSLTHRALAVALLARRRVVVARPLYSEDTELFLAALARLNYSVARSAEGVTIEPDGEPPAEATLDCGAAGTLFRFAVALAATLPGRTRIDGSLRLRERPVGALVAALRGLGVRIDCDRQEGHAPLVVHGGGLRGGRVALDASESSQYLSALLLAAQRAASPVEIQVRDLVSAPYVALTVDVVRRFGGRVEERGAGLWSAGPADLRGGEIEIEPDLSAAAYPAAAAALTGGDVLLERVQPASLQGDRRLLALLAEMGAEVVAEAAGVRVRGNQLAALDVDASDIPDQVPTLAALAPFATGTMRIENVAHLRLKESDRLAAMASELRRAGAEVGELPDGLVVPGVWAATPPPTQRVTIDAHDDHRIAMAMALVGLRRPGLVIAEPRVVAKSWPRFWPALAALLTNEGRGTGGA